MATTTYSLGSHAILSITLSSALLVAGVAAADEGLVQPGDVGSGALLLRTTEAGRYLEAPRLRTDVSITVTGTIARARITEAFENPSDRWVEGLYVFPLPADAGVDTLRMQVGDRFLEGEVRERKQARQIYERAAAEGVKATLIEQQRPNVFTNAVANIDPHGTVVVQIEYQHVVQLDGDRLSLRVPLVVGPRYANAGVADRGAIRAPVIDPKLGKINPVTLSVTLRAGVPLAGIASAYHAVEIVRPDEASATVTIVGDTPADRDFVLNWTLAPSAAPRATLFRESIGDETYYLALILPAVGSATRSGLPREAIFVIDNSGSMAGESMRQAKAALLLGLRSLGPADRFNVIRFDDRFETVFADAVPADRKHLAIAERFVERIDADGGTEILPALRAALADATPNDDTRLRQVVLLTDGAVGNEDQLLQEVGRSLGRSRVFTIGIGSAPNSYLMEHVARLGRGTFTHIGSEQEVGLRVSALLAKLESPVLTDLVATHDAELEVWPNPVPDLYVGEPIVLTAVSNGRAGTLRLAGRLGAAPWSAALDLASAVAGPGVEKLWARAKLGAIEEWRYRGAAQDDIDAEVLKLALQHHLVSRLSSLVAVDVTPSRPSDESLVSSAVPTNLPHGWDFEKVLGRDVPRPVFASRELLAKLVVADATKGADPLHPGLELPQTDAGTERQILFGALLLAIGVALSRLRSAAPRPC
jgi:Ca-activated chloride channel family protein